ncbi:MAG: glucosaminidase domain-containing protein [Phascolarctobacterium sp.]|nr:glucosaminidase domain-containing protein [Phascolarctobacterium sp.]
MNYTNHMKQLAIGLCCTLLLGVGNAKAAEPKLKTYNKSLPAKVQQNKEAPQMVRTEGAKGGVRIVTPDAAPKKEAEQAQKLPQKREERKQVQTAAPVLKEPDKNKEATKRAALIKKQAQPAPTRSSNMLVEKNGKSYFLGTELPSDYKTISIYGEPVAYKSQAVAYIKSANPKVKLACSVEELVELYWQEAEREGVRPDLALAQSLVETGTYAYGGDVQHHQNNFCGLGTTGGGVKGATFKTPEIGVRAHIQHLLAYTQKKRPQTKIVDPRYELAHNIRLERGVVDTWYGLNGTWAMGSNYCEKIMATYQKILAMPAPKTEQDNKNKKDKKSKDKKDKKQAKSMRERVQELMKERK